ncbi:hypothetical protein A8C75_11680 [Marinobacterium aestuarii]|uniref:Uncharacterized protein n=1 Tax=Marinobacterium aestuarii TaxID=1821621 RepID=A0A1A9EYV1_9GAMM|nr:EH signature domain-containing protein [Marinobacterium aestuarii]ANG63067.1 hypothetical protein A8C75_11680 [Marinobacterium aestuarii]
MDVLSLGIEFKAPAVKQPRKMLRLAKDVVLQPWTAVDNMTAFPPKTVDEIIRLLESGLKSEISILDWIHLFDSKQVWDACHNEADVARSSARIYDAIAENTSLTHLALFRAALTVDGSGQYFPALLLQHIHLLSDSLTGWRKELLDIVLLSRSVDFIKIALLVAEADVSVHEFFTRYRLPKCTRLKQMTVNQIPHVCETIDLASHAGWCLYMVRESERPVGIQILEVLLNKREQEIKGNAYFLKWLDESCHPRNDDGYWFDLSGASHAAIRRLIPLSDFQYFKMLVSFLCRHDVASALGIDEHSQKQIKSRSLFWQHYEGQIVSLRVLVPGNTYANIMKFNKSASWLEKRSEEQGSEAIVIEFESVIVLEVLRGEASEIRVFEKNSRNINLLLKDKLPSLLTIRKSHQDAVHDHAICWQWACEAWLRKSYKIEPDDNIKRFKGLPPHASPYERNKGLPTPEKIILERRSQEVEQWAKSFFARERELGKYSVDGDEAKAHELLLLGRQLERMGDYKKMAASLESAAKLGNRSAMTMLAKYFLTKARSSPELRMRGEVWLKKAAKLGDLQARQWLGMD